MKKIITILTFLLVFTWFSSCASSPALSSEQSGSSVWKITRNGNTLFLGGSIHLLRDGDFPLPKEFDLAFSQSEALVLEADVEQMESPEIVFYMIGRMYLRDGKTLQTLLDPEIYELLAATTLKYGFSLETVFNLKPSMVINTLSLLQMEKYGFTREGVDFYYQEKAKKENMPMQFLASIQSHIDILVSMGEGYENEFVRHSLEDIDETESALDLIVNDWKMGESSNIELSMAAMREEIYPLYKLMITDRHDAWIPQIEEFLDSGSVYFVIVGTAHLYGPDGLLKLLEDLGCVAEPLR